MRKKSQQEEAQEEHFLKARAIILSTTDACRETIPLISIMAALAEALMRTTYALLDADHDMHGNTHDSMACGRSLIELLGQQLEDAAKKLADEPRSQVH